MTEGLALWCALGAGIAVGVGAMTLLTQGAKTWGGFLQKEAPLRPGQSLGPKEPVAQALQRALALVQALQQADVPRGLASAPAATSTKAAGGKARSAVADKAQRLVEIMHGQEHNLASGAINAETVKETLKSLGAAANAVDNQVAQWAPFFTQAALDNQAVTGHLQSLQDQGRIFVTRSAAAQDEWQGMQTLLGRFAAAIGTLRESISAVQDLAGRAKLLSLNAAIVASQSQEHGRGFSVVADQIKGLSQRATGAADAMQGGVQGVGHFSDQLATLFEQQQSTLSGGRQDLEMVQDLTAQAATCNGALAQRLGDRAAGAGGDGDPALERMRESSSRLMGELVEYSAAMRLQDKEAKRARLLADEILHMSLEQAEDAAAAQGPTGISEAWLACASWQEHHLSQMRTLSELHVHLLQATARVSQSSDSEPEPL